MELLLSSSLPDLWTVSLPQGHVSLGRTAIHRLGGVAGCSGKGPMTLATPLLKGEVNSQQTQL